MTDWLAQLQALESRGESSVLLTVAGVRGSAPREPGASMIVTETETIGTIGGGQLEYQCAQIACRQLVSGADPGKARMSRRFVLGSGCGQCCGGVVDVMFEFLEGSRAGWLTELRQLHRNRTAAVVATSAEASPGKRVLCADGFAESAAELPRDVQAAAQDMLATSRDAAMIGGYLLVPLRGPEFIVAVFGAGHVGTALVDVLSRLDCAVRWIDSRHDILPRKLRANITTLESASPALEVAAMSPSTYYLVMTHSHSLDFDICDQVLRRDDAAYCGLIGSTSKRRRFERLMKKQGMSAARLARLTCPIGVPGIDGKKPAEIALAVAAELLQVRSALRHKLAAPAVRELAS
jgi:xanthine dehydrogenase accessory factor